jgi:hypothetical protein
MKRNFSRFFGVVAAVLIAGCATTPPPAPPNYVKTLTTLHVRPVTIQRVSAGRVLTFDDVADLVKCDVPGDKIVAYLRSTRAPYNYSQAQVNTLLNAGADSTLINYVGRSAGDFLVDAQNAQSQAELRQNAKWQKEAWRNPYFNDPAYWGVAPFPYAFPGEWY